MDVVAAGDGWVAAIGVGVEGEGKVNSDEVPAGAEGLGRGVLDKEEAVG